MAVLAVRPGGCLVFAVQLQKIGLWFFEAETISMLPWPACGQEEFLTQGSSSSASL